MGKESFLKVGWDRVYNYFTSRIIRRAFFFSLLFLILTFIILSIYNVNFTLRLFFAAGAICCFLTLGDSLITKAEFSKKLERIERNQYKSRISRTEGPLYEQKEGVFEEQEQRYLKRKKKEHNYTIVVKFFFFAIFVVLLFA